MQPPQPPSGQPPSQSQYPPQPQYPPQYPPQVYPYPPPQQPAKGVSTGAKVAIALVAVLIVAVVSLMAINFLRTSTSSPVAQPNVHVTNTAATYTCPAFSSPTETFSFTLVNSGNANAYVSVGFYSNGQLVDTNNYYAQAGSSLDHRITAPLGSCPSSGSTYDIQIMSVTTA